jgi:transcriptional regulator with XRE-family HTH domain
MFKFGIGGADMPTRTPIPVSRAMRQISANLDLARRQQRIPVALLAERAGLSMPTVTKMLRTGNGSFENFLRIARLLGLLDGVQQATDPLNTDIGKLRADEDTPKRIR